MVSDQTREEGLRLLAELRKLIARLEEEVRPPAVQAPAPMMKASRRVALSDPAAIAAHLYKSRRHRDRFFDSALFADPAWDILLDLFAARARGRRVCVSSACLAAAVPPTTGLRWLENLELRGMIERQRDPVDGRRVYVSLTSDAVRRLSAYLSEVDTG